MDRSGMARSLAKLLATSDLEELRETVERWRATATTEDERHLMLEMGTRLLDVKAALAAAPEEPTEDELESIIEMMLLVAGDPGAVKPPIE